MKRNIYYEKIYIQEINLWHTPVLKTPSEGDIKLRVLNRTNNLQELVECFIHGNEIRKIIDSELKKGNSGYVEFSLMSYELNRSSLRENSLTKVGSYTYRLNGKVVRLNPLVVDCGLYIRTDVQTTERLRIGDYVQLEGRLDVRFVR